MPDPTGWMPGVDHIATQEWGYSDVAEDQMYPQAVMHHVMQGYWQTMADWARNSNGGKSAHFIVRRDGHIAQTVSIWNPAWHAGDVNNPSWSGISRFGPNPNKYTVGIEQEGFSISPKPAYSEDYLYDAANPWPQAMVDAVIRINQWVFQSCANWMRPTEETVITHSMTNRASRAQDPGDLWRTTVLPQILSSFQTPAPAPPSGDAIARELIRESIGLLQRAEVAIK